MSTVGVGIIGLGFMGRVHAAALNAAIAAGYPARLVAVCDSDPERRSGLVDVAGNAVAPQATGERLWDPAEVAAYASTEEILADAGVTAVSICTRTDTHVDFAIAALEAGRHVLVEKPVDLREAEVDRLRTAATSAERICIPAMCMRFWPGWSWLKQRIDDQSFGAVRSAAFHRLGSMPAWSRAFYGDASQSGGALVDLHIHDVDFIRWCFGDPAAVVSTGDIHHLTTLYRYPHGPRHVVAEGGWDHDPGFEFRMRYIVVFEGATADFDMGRDPQLLLIRDGTAEPVSLEAGAGYDGELRHFIDLAAGRATQPLVTLDDALAVTRLLAAERTSLERGAEVPLG